MSRDQLALLIVAGAVVAGYLFVIRPLQRAVGAVGDAGAAINDGLVPGPGSLGTSFYDWLNGAPEFRP